MARNSIEQMTIKAQALKEAIEELKEASTPTENLVTYQKVVDLANENYSEKLESKISQTSIKKPSPKNQDFKEIKAEIERFREEHRNIKSIAPKKSKKEVADLREQVSNLVSEIAKLYDGELLKSEKIAAQEKTIAKLKNDRARLQKEIDTLRSE